MTKAVKPEAPAEISHKELMHPTAVSRPFNDPAYIFQLKHDGFRCLAIKRGDLLKLSTRNGNDLSPCFPEIVECLSTLPDVVVDGELVVLDDQGRPDWDRLCKRAAKKKK